VFPDSDHAAALFNMERAGHVYSRISNPTCAVLEERIAALEGGVGAIATASGQAALHLAIVTLLGAGEHIVASRALYGGSHNLLDFTLPRFGVRRRSSIRGISTRGVRRSGPRRGFCSARRSATRSRRARHSARGGPRARPRAAAARRLDVHDAVSAATVRAGADLVFHSATKFLSGHGVVIGGCSSIPDSSIGTIRKRAASFRR
jgi:O-acetylhomoserine (thiol)-lyase